MSSSLFAKQGRRAVGVAVAAWLSASCGGGSGDKPVCCAGPTVATVTVSPATAITFGALGRTASLTAQAKDASSTVIPGATITWSSSNTAAATVTSAGVVTAVANGTTLITATSGTINSTAVSVTVAQVPVAVVMSPTSIAFGAIGKTRLVAATVNDSTGNAIPGSVIAWSRLGPGTVATVSAGGLATAVAVGVGDTARAASGALVGKTPISVTQVVNTVTVASPSLTPDTLFTATRTRQFTATALDSNSNAIPGQTFAWTSSATGVATVGAATGLVTAGTTAGSTNIQASTSGVNGVRTMVLRHYPATFSITPTVASITTPNGTKLFTGVAQDSVSTNLQISWLSRNAAFATVNPATGTTTTATAVANGSTYVVISSGTRSDSASLAVSGQGAAIINASVNIGGLSFTSNHNGTVNPAIDTVSVGGAVTWNFQVGTHFVQSSGGSSFTNSPTQSSGTYVFTFNTIGTYNYICGIHGAVMSGTVVVK
jgi:plastocyanin